MTSGTRVGTVIEEKYRLDKQIGHGSMGAVYRGTQLMVDRSVAIKLLHPTFAGHDKIQARFEVEAKAIARLNHPNCITLFDFGYSEDMAAFYTVVEFIDGIPLGDLINQHPPVKRVVELIRQMASALGHAHHHGILHRDLKPENIMLATMTDGREMVKVLDFGIAQIMKGTAEEGDEEPGDFESDRITRVGEVFGTPPYMSPEQCESARDLTPATDLYSLGIIFYELLEGRLPFFADTPVEIMRMHLNEEPPPMTRAGVPEALESIVLQMLAKDPDIRPDSGDQIVKMLEEIPEDDLAEDGQVARAPGDARETDPTLLSAPPPSDTIIVDDGDDDLSEASEPGEASEIYKLDDLVEEPLQTEKAAPTTGQVKTPDAPISAHKKTDSLELVGQQSDVSTAGILDTGAQEVKALASKIASEEKKMLFGVIFVVLLTGAAMVWIILEYEPFSMADEEDLSTIGRYAAGPHGSQGEDDGDDGIDDLHNGSQEFVGSDDDDDEFGEIFVDDEDDEFVDDVEFVEEDEEDEEHEDIEEGEDAEEEIVEETPEPSQPSRRPTRTAPQPEPEPSESPRQPPRLGVDDPAPSDDDEEEPEEEEPRGPPRLGL